MSGMLGNPIFMNFSQMNNCFNSMASNNSPPQNINNMNSCFNCFNSLHNCPPSNMNNMNNMSNQFMMFQQSQQTQNLLPPLNNNSCNSSSKIDSPYKKFIMTQNLTEGYWTEDDFTKEVIKRYPDKFALISTMYSDKNIRIKILVLYAIHKENSDKISELSMIIKKANSYLMDKIGKTYEELKSLFLF